MVITYIGLGATLLMVLMLTNGLWYLIPIKRLISICSLILTLAATFVIMPSIKEAVPPLESNHVIAAVCAFMLWIFLNLVVKAVTGLFKKTPVRTWADVAPENALVREMETADVTADPITKTEAREALAESGYENVSDEMLQKTFFYQMGNVLKTMFFSFWIFCIVPCYIMNDKIKRTDIGISLTNPVSELMPLVLILSVMLGMCYFVVFAMRKAGLIDSDKTKIAKPPFTKQIFSVMTALVKGGVLVVILYCFLAMAIKPEILQKTAAESDVINLIQQIVYELKPLFPENTGISFVLPKQ